MALAPKLELQARPAAGDDTPAAAGDSLCSNCPTSSCARSSRPRSSATRCSSATRSRPSRAPRRPSRRAPRARSRGRQRVGRRRRALSGQRRRPRGGREPTARRQANGAEPESGGWASLRPRTHNAFGGEDTNLEDFVAAGLSLADYLTEQLHVVVSDPAERLIGAHLIHMVDEAGYLRVDLDDLADKLGAPRSLIEKVLGDAAGLRSAGRVRARPRRVPGAAAQGPEPLRPADRQAARQPGAARRPQSRGAEARSRRRLRRSSPT